MDQVTISYLQHLRSVSPANRKTKAYVETTKHKQVLRELLKDLLGT